MTPLPAYCERMAAGWLGEPLNFVSNLCFLLAAGLTYASVRKTSGTYRPYLTALCALIATVGLGSAIFHAWPGKATLPLDAIPIYAFILASLTLLLYRLTERWFVSVGLAAGFASILALVTLLVPPSFLNGSSRHLTTLIAVGLLALQSFKKYGAKGWGLVAVGALYGLAIAARSLDRVVCPAFPPGTHFLWHILVAGACFCTVRFFLKILPPHR